MPHGRVLLTTLLLCAIGMAQGEEKPSEAPAETASAENTTPPIERPPLIEQSEEQAQALARQFPRQAKTLQAGEEAFMGFWRPAQAAQPKGTIILIPGAGETPDWPRVVGPLWRALPEYGWNTLSISLPDPQILIPKRSPAAPETTATADGAESTAEASAKVEPSATTDATESQDTEAEEDDTPKAAERINARIEAALAFAQAQGSSIVILMGHGTGAYWAGLYLSQEGTEAVQQLSLIQPKAPVGENVPLEDLISKLKSLAISDFYDENLPFETKQAQQRLENSIRSQHPAYYQVPLRITAGDLTHEQGQLVRRVRGWLDRQVSGRL